MITNRFYITTIITIFLSLSMGILIGGTLGQQWIQENQEKVVQYFQSEANLLREKNRSYEQNVKQLESEIKTKNNEMKLMLEKSLNQMIEGKKLLWIENQSGGVYPQLKDAIRIAGGISEQVHQDEMVFNSLPSSENKNESSSEYDVIIYVPTSKEEFLNTSTQFPSTTPVVVVSNEDLKKSTQLSKVYYQKMNSDSPIAHYEFIVFIKTLLEEQKE